MSPTVMDQKIEAQTPAQSVESEPFRTLYIELEPGGGIPVEGMPGVKIEEAHTLGALDALYARLRSSQDKGKLPFDVIVLDTITFLAEVTWQQGLEVASGDIWEHRADFDKYSQRLYGNASKMINRLLMQYRGLKAHTVFVCHEEERKIPPNNGPNDPAILSPSVNPALLNPLLAWSDALVHLGKTSKAMRVGGDRVPRDVRRLLLEGNSVYRAKTRIPLALQPGPVALIDPTLREFLSYINTGAKPSRITLYGAPGVGKTTFACGGRPTLPRDLTHRVNEALKGQTKAEEEGDAEVKGGIRFKLDEKLENAWVDRSWLCLSASTEGRLLRGLLSLYADLLVALPTKMIKEATNDHQSR